MSAAAAAIAALCAKHGVSWAELSRRTGISSSGIQRWLKGEVVPSLESRRLVARALDEPLSALLVEGEVQIDTPSLELSQSEREIDRYLASADAEDLTDDEARQLRLSAGLVPGRHPLNQREVRLMADLVRMRLRRPEELRAFNPPSRRRRGRDDDREPDREPDDR